MRLLTFSKWLPLAACLAVLSLQCEAAQNTTTETNTDQIIQRLYHNLNNDPTMDMPTRLDVISTQFVGKPYLLGALGEGIDGDYDQFPLYRTDAFDCETYVDTVLAIALAKNARQFQHCINRVRYHEGHVSFIHRNHFTCLDWNKNNQQQGFVNDITTRFQDKHKQPVAKFAQATINKPGWYQHMTTKNIRVNNIDRTEQVKRLQSLQHKGNQLRITNSTIPYIPFSALFDKNGKANHYLFNQIPNGAIIEIIRPNWNLNKEIGTHLNVSHLGFAFWKNGTLLFRQASSTYNKVVDTPLINYLRAAQKSPTIKGINIQTVSAQAKLCNKYQ